MDRPQPIIDDWVDGQPDSWDYEAVLSECEVTVEALENFDGYELCWCQGFMHIPTINETHARKAAALFVVLWLRGFSASFADKLMDGFLYFLESQEPT
jgi:hypothetical protein